MKCATCGKTLDPVDSECGMCTFCGTRLETSPAATSEKA